MPERLLKEFQKRAEVLVPVPDLDELQKRGMARGELAPPPARGSWHPR